MSRAESSDNEQELRAAGRGNLVFLKRVGVSDCTDPEWGLSRLWESEGEALASHLLLYPIFPPSYSPPRG